VGVVSGLEGKHEEEEEEEEEEEVCTLERNVDDA
jgi:hypothetical protein